MAKINFGVGVADARNSVGGHTFSKNQFGAYIRQKVSPVQPRTARQQIVRQQLTDLSKRWGAVLTDAQRVAWVALAGMFPVIDVFGNTQVLSGLQFYVRVNRNLQEVSAAGIDDAPLDQSVGSPGIVSLTATASSPGPGALSVVFTNTPLGATEHLVVFASPGLSPGKTFVQSFLKLTKAAAGAATVSPFVITTEWVALFGPILSGAKIAVGVSVINDVNGAASPAQQASIVVA